MTELEQQHTTALIFAAYLEGAGYSPEVNLGGGGILEVAAAIEAGYGNKALRMLWAPYASDEIILQEWNVREWDEIDRGPRHTLTGGYIVLAGLSRWLYKNEITPPLEAAPVAIRPAAGL
jgi:hypothetical protein